MKQSTALQHLRIMMKMIQRARSIIRETWENETGLADLYPWIFGEKCPLLPLEKIITDAERSGILKGCDYMNFMYLLYNFMPEVRLASAIDAMGLPDEMIRPNEYLMGWEEE